jgi:hypothetical protein
VYKLTIKILDVPKWKITTKQWLQVLYNDYKHTGYDNNYKINLAISFSMVADLCQLQFVVFSFCRGEKTTKR